MENNTWIKLFRKFTEWEWYDDTVTKSVFLHFLLKANYEDREWKGITIKRGSFVTSLDSIYNELNKIYRTGKINGNSNRISMRSIRTAISHLIMTKEVTKETTPSYTIISINNYDEYQQMTKKVATKRQTTDKQLTTTKEYNNINNNIYNNYIGTPKNSINILSEESTIKELAEYFSLPEEKIKQELLSMKDWIESKGKRYKNYIAFARNWIRRGKNNEVNKKNTFVSLD